MSGVAEEAAEFKRDDLLTGQGRFRRFSDCGPVYEVIAGQGDSTSEELVETGERVSVPLLGVLADPIAP